MHGAPPRCRNVGARLSAVFSEGVSPPRASACLNRAPRPSRWARRSPSPAAGGGWRCPPRPSRPLSTRGRNRGDGVSALCYLDLLVAGRVCCKSRRRLRPLLLHNPNAPSCEVCGEEGRCRLLDAVYPKLSPQFVLSIPALGAYNVSRRISSVVVGQGAPPFLAGLWRDSGLPQTSSFEAALWN